MNLNTLYMSSITEYTNPRNRDFSQELKEMELDTILERQRDIDIVIGYGMFPDWASFSTGNKITDIKYWDLEDILRYRKVLLMELLDRCKTFELYPKIKFKF